MTKYVDIDAAKEAVRKAECDADYDGRRFDAEFIENALDFIPAADVAPVVRCKECKWAGGDFVCYRGVMVQHKSEDFCSYGERKEGAEC